MPIASEKDGKIIRFVEEPFRNEEELQACLERCPYLLITESEMPVVTVQREVVLPAAGILDVLLVDADGVPVAVEVKLARNAQSRREVVAQAFDYVSDLTLLTVDELDDVVDGALIKALEEFENLHQGANLRKQCGTNLRAGRIKVVVAVDEASEGLIRIVRYINDHSDLDVRLVAISKFDNGRLLIPRILVAGNSASSQKPRFRQTSVQTDPQFDAFVEAYDSIADEQMRTRGLQKRYRQIRPDTWPKGLHYEFFNYADEIGVELHIENEAIKPLAKILSSLNGSYVLPEVALQWDPRWSKNRGRLLAKFGKDEASDRVANAMRALINQTHHLIDLELLIQQKTGDSFSIPQVEGLLSSTGPIQ
jgi:hypothetical protein